MGSDVTDPLDQILDAAKRHGEEGDPDHEVGDLQIALKLAWAALPANARAKVHAEYFEDEKAQKDGTD